MALSLLHHLYRYTTLSTIEGHLATYLTIKHFAFREYPHHECMTRTGHSFGGGAPFIPMKGTTIRAISEVSLLAKKKYLLINRRIFSNVSKWENFVWANRHVGCSTTSKIAQTASSLPLGFCVVLVTTTKTAILLRRAIMYHKEESLHVMVPLIVICIA